MTMETFYNFYHLVGPAGLVLIVLAVVAVHMAFKSWIFIYLTGRDFYRAARGIRENPDTLPAVFERYERNPIVAIISDVLKSHGRHSDDLRAEVAYLFHRHFARTQRDLSILRVVALIAPMLGLLGTLLGLSGVFKTLATTQAVTTSMVLAAGIWEAILTTIMGLTLAIPAIMASYLLRLKLKGFHLTAIEYSYRFLDNRSVPSLAAKTNHPGPKKVAA
ncbi:MAG: MotA/TolQ/ExbB proton channel family protein [Deltaproteobacteria bacterium]|jgi:biopolymer transport protein ExbB|nr:MotA/TolQ/ExbB proton channel family protein [Deltaproteobacteria bacterium]